MKSCSQYQEQERGTRRRNKVDDSVLTALPKQTQTRALYRNSLNEQPGVLLFKEMSIAPVPASLIGPDLPAIILSWLFIFVATVPFRVRVITCWPKARVSDGLLCLLYTETEDYWNDMKKLVEGTW